MTTVEARTLAERATREPTSVLRVWLHDGRRWVQRVAAAELKKRGAA